MSVVNVYDIWRWKEVREYPKDNNEREEAGLFIFEFLDFILIVGSFSWLSFEESRDLVGCMGWIGAYGGRYGIMCRSMTVS